MAHRVSEPKEWDGAEDGADGRVRIYADLGAGVAVITANRDFSLFEMSTNRTGWATRDLDTAQMAVCPRNTLGPCFTAGHTGGFGSS